MQSPCGKADFPLFSVAADCLVDPTGKRLGDLRQMQLEYGGLAVTVADLM